MEYIVDNYLVIRSETNQHNNNDLHIEFAQCKDNDSYVRRIGRYYQILQKMYGKSFEKDWDEYKEFIENEKDAFKEYKVYFEDKSNDVEEDCVKVYSKVTEDTSNKTRSIFNELWKKIRDVIEKEISIEKSLYEILQETAANHPIIAKIVIAVLTGILLGLIEDCIHDGIQNSKKVETTQTVNIYLQENEDSLNNDNSIKIKDIIDML